MNPINCLDERVLGEYNYFFQLPEDIQIKIFIMEHKAKMKQVLKDITFINTAYVHLLYNPCALHKQKVCVYRREYTCDVTGKKQDLLYFGNGSTRNKMCVSHYYTTIEGKDVFWYNSLKFVFGNLVENCFLYRDYGIQYYDKTNKHKMKEFLKMNNIKYKSKHTKDELFKIMLSF